MSRIPRYHQIAQALRHRIEAGHLRPGARLDNQRRLAREFKVTLMTLRHALEILDRDGLITRRHGLGTFVAAPAIDYDILHLRALAGDLSASGEDVATRFLRSHFARPDAQVARGLGLGRADRVFVLERLRLVDGRPMSLQISCVPRAVGEELAKIDLAVTPLRQVLAFKLGIDITAARETVAAVLLEARVARELGCRRGAAAFRSDRVSLGPDGAPVVYDRVFIPGDRFRITRQLAYTNGAPEGPRPASEPRPQSPPCSTVAPGSSASPTKEPEA
jgi:GntR family transcriptional regulator